MVTAVTTRLACPHCLSPAPRLLAGISSFVKVDYFRCIACGHIWTVRKVLKNAQEESFDAAVLKPSPAKARLRTKNKSIRHR